MPAWLGSACSSEGGAAGAAGAADAACAAGDEAASGRGGGRAAAVRTEASRSGSRVGGRNLSSGALLSTSILYCLGEREATSFGDLRGALRVRPLLI